jgi:hypothetical protein
LLTVASATAVAMLAAANGAEARSRADPNSTDGSRLHHSHLMSARQRAASASHNPLLNQILSQEE